MLLTKQSGKGTSLPCRNLDSSLWHLLEEEASGQQVGALGLPFFVVQGAVLLFSLQRVERVGQEAEKPV